MSATSSINASYAKRSTASSLFTMFGFDRAVAMRQKRRVLGHDDLIQALNRERAAGRLRNKDVEEVLKLPSSRVTQIFNNERRVTLDEAKRLVETFDLDESEPGDRAARLPEQAAKLFVYHAAKALGANTNQAQAEALAEDLQGFVEFATLPEVRDEIDRVQQFFLGRLPGSRDASPGSA